MARDFTPDDHMHGTITPDLDESAEMTMIIWFQLDSSGTNDYIMSLPEGIGGLNGMGIRMDTATEADATFVTHSASDFTIANSAVSTTSFDCLGLYYANVDGGFWKNGTEIDTTAIGAGAGIKHASGELAIMSFSSSLTTGFIPNGKAAWAALWDSKLPDVCMQALARGANPFACASGNLIHLYPIHGNESPEPDFT